MTRQGSNSVQVRHYNERVVLDTIRRLGEASKAEIARQAHLTPQAIAGIVDGLMAAGYIEIKSRRSGYVGSPSQMYGLASGGGLFRWNPCWTPVTRMPVDRLSRAHKDLLFPRIRVPDPRDVLTFAREDLEKLRRELSSEARGRVVGIGIAMPYFLGGWNDELGFSKTIVDAWVSINFAKSWRKSRVCRFIWRTTPLPRPPLRNWYMGWAHGNRFSIFLA